MKTVCASVTVVPDDRHPATFPRRGGVPGWAMLGICASLLPACAGYHDPTIYEDPSAMVVLSSTQSSPVHGVVTFLRTGGATRISANLSGFKPNTSHGMHIHEKGDCSARDAASAGEHFNPTSSQHGSPSAAPHHGGDLGNVTADSKGEVFTSFDIEDGAFGSGPDSIIGRGLIVHADTDDLKSQPAGNSGARVACGLITRNPDKMTYAKAGQP